MNTIFIITIAALVPICAVLGIVLAQKNRDITKLNDQLHDSEDNLSAQQRLTQELNNQKIVSDSSIANLRETSARTLHEKEELQKRVHTLIEERTTAQTNLTETKRQLDQQQQSNTEEQSKLEERYRAQFKNLANDILNEQTQQFKQSNKESLDILLKPFKDNITSFRERVEKIYADGNQQQGALQNELKNLMELNNRITTETTNLTNALRGNSKVQGDWGEMILETILDNSNLIKGIHYDTQESVKDEENRDKRPDVVLYLPDQKRIIIDSKVSLTAFVNYTNSDNELERKGYLDQHIKSVRQHVKELGRKEYQKLFNSPDFVVMFMPNEPAFLTALQVDDTIWSDAYEKKVIVSSPTNLFALLKLVADIWKRSEQNKNTAEIVTQGTKLYDQLVAFTGSLESVGVALDKAKDSYDDAYKRLCTGNNNIIRQGEKLRKLGLPTKKEQSTKTLEGADLLDLE